MKKKINLPIDKKRFSIPKNYFNNIGKKVLEIKKLNHDVFEVPEGYFESINANEILKKNHGNNKNILQLNFYKIASLAAVFIFLIFLNYNNNIAEQDINSTDIINYIDEDSFTLTISEYSELFDTSDIDFSNLILQHDIENYLIDNYEFNAYNIIFD